RASRPIHEGHLSLEGAAAMGKATLQKASDGVLARVAPTWTEEKLRILACYLEGFAKACRKAGGWYSLDLFAGGGLNISAQTAAEIAGSPPRARVRRRCS